IPTGRNSRPRLVMFTSSGTKGACGTRPKKLTMARTGRSRPARRARSSISPRFERSRSCSDRYVSGARSRVTLCSRGRNWISSSGVSKRTTMSSRLSVPKPSGSEGPVPAPGLALRKLVALREGRKHAGLAGGEEVLHGAVVLRGRAPDVEEPYDPGESRPVKATGEQALERRPVGLARLGVAVAGEVENVIGAGSGE